MTTSSWTLPAHASLLTGLFPSRHRLHDDGVKLFHDLPVLAELLRGDGYETFAIVSHVYVSREFGLDRGFDDFDDSLIDGGRANPVAEVVVDRFIQRLAKVGDRPFFAFVHFFDPHWPYQPPAAFEARFTDPSYRGEIDGSVSQLVPYYQRSVEMPEADRRQMIALYDGEIAYLDEQIGRLSRALAAAPNPRPNAGPNPRPNVVFLTADHGEEFKEHGQLGHARTLFSEMLHVPLIVVGHPALAKGERRDELVSIIDVAPTVLDMAGLAMPDGSADLDGRSLLRASPDDRTLFAESIRFGIEIRAARRGRYKLIEAPAAETHALYDLVTDPLEQEALEFDPTNGELRAALASYTTATESGWHLKLVGLGVSKLRLRGEVRTTGRIVTPRHYASKKIHGSTAEVRKFQLGGESGDVLELDVEVTNHVAEIVFEVDPPDAPVTFDLALTDATGAASMFIGQKEALQQGVPIALARDDPRLAGAPADYWTSEPGLYIRAVSAGRLDAEPTQLSKEVIEHLDALGYGSSEPE